MVEELVVNPEVMLLVAQYLRKVPDLERFHGRVKASINSSAVLLLPLIGSKTLKQRVSLIRKNGEKMMMWSVCLFLE